ncbi:MAG: hypothetical protein KID09_10050 [Paenibacillus macerans]|uniref:hypothetical protein n=1 Tax=Paenibacillus macerans TaxID=44252 RepID=UPI002430597A|nr:hypothetical protein [Paenibacillus macerans]MBS5910974.1 hypothetical protein [Paenibacillus macerans]
MRNWFVAVLPLLLIVALPPFAASGSLMPGTQAVSGPVQGPHTVTVYVNRLELCPRGGTLAADPILWYEGEEAAAAFAVHEPDAGIDGPPDGYYIVNDVKETVEYPVAKNAEVLMQIYDRTGRIEDIQVKWNEPVSLEKFGRLFGDNDLIDLSRFPYHLTIEGGQVVRIVQQFIP